MKSRKRLCVTGGGNKPLGKYKQGLTSLIKFKSMKSSERSMISSLNAKMSV